MTYKQVFLVNSDLGMSKGKIPAMVAHGELYYMEAINKKLGNVKLENFNKWRYEENELMKKIVIKASEKEITGLMLDLKEKDIWYHIVIDMGLTQVPRGSLACLVVEPILEEDCDKLFKHLKLL